MLVASLAQSFFTNPAFMDTKLKTALHILADQYDAQGGHFTTTEADFMFKECFCEFGETIPDAFRRLLTNKPNQENGPKPTT